MEGSPHILFLLNPGRTSRPYLLGLRNGAAKLGVAHTSLELGPLWGSLSGAGDRAAALGTAQREIAQLVRARGITHAIGYAFNGADLGCVRTQTGEPAPLLAALGVRHIMLWTDHPEWCINGEALAPGPQRLLNHPNHIHLLKSQAAAAEAAAVLGWENVIAMPMAEDTHQVRPATGLEPLHDVCIVMSDARAVPEALRTFLADPDPSANDMDRAMLPGTRATFLKAALSRGGGAMLTEFGALADAWLAAKLAAPESSFHRLSLSLPGAHASALSWLSADPQRWYTGIRALRQMVAWRRNFWPAWLARRMDVGIYGCDASALGANQPAGAEAWVPYQSLPGVFALGRVALTINAAHDEEGVTHKPFQIGAAGVACIHQRSRGLEDLFEDGLQIDTFAGGAELESRVRALTDHLGRRRARAQALRGRMEREHDWSARLEWILDDCGRGLVGINNPTREASVMANPL